MAAPLPLPLLLRRCWWRRSPDAALEGRWRCWCCGWRGVCEASRSSGREWAVEEEGEGAGAVAGRVGDVVTEGAEALSSSSGLEEEWRAGVGDTVSGRGEVGVGVRRYGRDPMGAVTAIGSRAAARASASWASFRWGYRKWYLRSCSRGSMRQTR